MPSTGSNPSERGEPLTRHRSEPTSGEEYFDVNSISSYEPHTEQGTDLERSTTMALTGASMQTDPAEPTFTLPPPSFPPTPPPQQAPPVPMPSFKEIKMNTLTPFAGDRMKLDNFLMEVEMYMKINNEIYNTNTKKIIFTLSYMKEGTAGPWKHSYWSNTITTNNMGSWGLFKRVLKESFSTFDKPGDVIIKMEMETMTGMTADQYIEQFKIWAAKSEVFQD